GGRGAVRVRGPQGARPHLSTRGARVMMRPRQALIAIAWAAALALAADCGPAMAADFYAGKTINFIAGTDVGGGFSIYARAIAKHLPRFIPGNPTIVVKNMPGAGGATASAWLYRIAPQDGTAIASVSPNAILGRLLDDSQTQYDPTRFTYLAGPQRTT